MEKTTKNRIEELYDASSITVLEGLEAVRKRPGMYIGSTGPRGLHHLLYEVVDNSIDEYLAGHCNNIWITLHADDSVTVVDDGRGIPVDVIPQYKKSAAEVVLTTLHAGGKFGGKGYRVSGGLHGVGLSVVNALSEWLILEVGRGNAVYQQRYERGQAVTELKEVGSATKSGTIVHFKPDPEIFETTRYDFDVIGQRMREMAFLSQDLRIEVVDEREETENQAVFKYS
jgi:DNA gyrase subunit B